MKAFKQTQGEFHESSNSAKNASLYVDWVDGEFVAPSDRITKEMLAEITERNAEFLGYAHNGLKMLRRLEKAPDVMMGLLSGFVEQAEKLREQKSDDFIGAMETLLSGFLEEGKQKYEGLDLKLGALGALEREMAQGSLGDRRDLVIGSIRALGLTSTLRTIPRVAGRMDNHVHELFVLDLFPQFRY